MTPERWQQIEKIFKSALLIPSTKRAAFLREICVGDSNLQQSVEELLAADEFTQNEDFLTSPFYFIGKRVSHYFILNKLGAGGMGEVFLARDSESDRLIALKIFPDQMIWDEDNLRRFATEVQAASALHHPNVARIYEFGESDETRFIAMEYVDGETLSNTIKNAPLELIEILRIGIQLCKALEVAHSKGIIHRDLKPANIMRTPGGNVKLLDFGLAKFSVASERSGEAFSSLSDRTESGVVMGTVPYTSPEQLLGRRVDQTTDLFSLGVVLYQMATQRLPFEGKTAIETIDSILHSAPASPSELNNSIPEFLSRIILRLMAKASANRYKSATQVRATLEAAQNQTWTTTRLSIPYSSSSRLIMTMMSVMIALTIGWKQSSTVFHGTVETPISWANGKIIKSSAYHAYMRGMNYFERDNIPENFQLSIQMFQKAVDIDPTFAAAYAALSRAHSFFYFGNHDPEHLTKSKAALDRALAIQPELPETRVALALYYYRCLSDYNRALYELESIEMNNANNVVVLSAKGAILRRVGKFDEAIATQKQAFRINPHDPTLALDIGISYEYLHRYAQAQKYFEESISIGPDLESGYIEGALNLFAWKGDVTTARDLLNQNPKKDSAEFRRTGAFLDFLERKYESTLNLLSPSASENHYSSLRLGSIYRFLGKTDLARASFQSAQKQLEKEIRINPKRVDLHRRLGVAYAGLGQKEDAISEGKLALELLPISNDAIIGAECVENLAYIYTLLGEQGAAIQQLAYLLSIPSRISIPVLRLSPQWDPLRSNPHFQKILHS